MLLIEGTFDGMELSDGIILIEGAPDGTDEGTVEGPAEGATEGTPLGASEGLLLGGDEGPTDGIDDGAGVICGVSAKQESVKFPKDTHEPGTSTATGSSKSGQTRA